MELITRRFAQTCKSNGTGVGVGASCRIDEKLGTCIFARFVIA